MRGSANKLHHAAGAVLVLLGLGSAALLWYGFAVGKNAYAAPLAGLIALLLVTLRMGQPRRARMTLLLSSIAGCCYLAEVVLAVLLPFRAARASWERGGDYDFRTYHGVVRGLRQEGSDAFPRHVAGSVLYHLAPRLEHQRVGRDIQCNYGAV